MWFQNLKRLFSQKTYFKWKEPKEFLRQKDAEERARLRWWFQPLMVVVNAAILMAGWYMGRFNPHKHPPSFHTAIMMVLPLSAIYVYGISYIIVFSPATVRLSEKFISRSRGNAHWRIMYADIEYFAWRIIGGVTTLVLKRRKAKREILLGLSPEVFKEDVHLFLLSRNVIPKSDA